MLLPTRCPICDQPGPAPCRACIAALRRPHDLGLPPGLDECHAALVYDGGGRRLLTRLKYGNARSSVPWLVRAMGDLVDLSLVDVVTWVPTTGARRRSRGYDQARLLARGVARHARRPCRCLLRRRPGPVQTGQSRQARWLRPAFDVRRVGSGVDGRRVLVVDDIITTGATMAAAAAALRGAGAVTVVGLAAAHTPLNSVPIDERVSQGGHPAVRWPR